MGSKKNGKRRDNFKQNNKDVNIDKFEEKDEADLILEQLDRMEQLKKEQEEKVDISSKVRGLIKSDKEAIKKYNEMEEELNSDSDELDYLDDEKFDDFVPVTVKGEADSKNDSEKEKKAIDSSGTSDNKEEKLDSDSNKEINSEEVSKENKEPIQGNKKKNKKKNSKNVSDGIKNTEEDKKSGVGDKDVNLDFFANIEKQDKEHATMLRKQQPNRLRVKKTAEDSSIKDVVGFFTENVRNLAIAVTICALFIVLMVALVVDSRNHKSEEKTNTKSYKFIEIDEEKSNAMVDVIDNYYDAVVTQNTGEIKKIILDGDKLSTSDVLVLIEEQAALSVFMDEDKLSNPFNITEAKFINGREKNEYIVFTKYQFTINGCTEPVSGIVSWYIVEDNKGENVTYKISTKLYDTSSKVSSYVNNVLKQKEVKEYFAQVNDELIEACKKDDVLRKLVFDMYGDMINNNSSIDSNFRDIIAELKEFEEVNNSDEKTTEEKKEENSEKDDKTEKTEEESSTEKKSNS